jgi:hypothetical protein
MSANGEKHRCHRRLRHHKIETHEDPPHLESLDSEDYICADDDSSEDFDMSLSETIKKQDRRVRFDTIQVREHAITLGDHPFCSDRLALTLDWKHSEESIFNIDVYENVKSHHARNEHGHLVPLDFWRRRRLLHIVSGLTDHNLILLEEERLHRPRAWVDTSQPPPEEFDLFCDLPEPHFPADMLQIKILEN